ncbi:MAG: DUF4097 domain-containing protein [Oscillospiraceae bacterium]|jgi:hypothetical protein|nr:DUF4097 domain-containing protein [Oscillospiraceae bacterium]
MTRKILTSIAVIAIVAGVVLIVAAWGLGAEGVVSFGLSGLRVTRHGEAATLSQRGIEGVTSLTVDAIDADVEFIPADDFGFDIRTFYGEPDWSLDGGKLVIDEARIGGMFRVEFPLLPPLTADGKISYIKIYYPRDSELNNLTVSTVSGNIEFPGLDKRVRESSLSTVSGNISAASLETDTLGIHTVSGNIETRDVASPRARLDTTSGDASLTAFLGKLEADTVSGNIEILTDTDEDKLEYKIETISGDIKVGGLRLGGPVRSSPPNADTSLDIETVSGDVTINNFNGGVG